MQQVVFQLMNKVLTTLSHFQDVKHL